MKYIIVGISFLLGLLVVVLASVSIYSNFFLTNDQPTANIVDQVEESVTTTEIPKTIEKDTDIIEPDDIFERLSKDSSFTLRSEVYIGSENTTNVYLVNDDSEELVYTYESANSALYPKYISEDGEDIYLEERYYGGIGGYILYPTPIRITKLSAENNELEDVINNDSFVIIDADISPDGETLLYSRSKTFRDKVSIAILDLTTQTELLADLDIPDEFNGVGDFTFNQSGYAALLTMSYWGPEDERVLTLLYLPSSDTFKKIHDTAESSNWSSYKWLDDRTLLSSQYEYGEIVSTTTVTNAYSLDFDFDEYSFEERWLNEGRNYETDLIYDLVYFDEYGFEQTLQHDVGQHIPELRQYTFPDIALKNDGDNELILFIKQYCCEGAISAAYRYNLDTLTAEKMNISDTLKKQSLSDHGYFAPDKNYYASVSQNEINILDLAADTIVNTLKTPSDAEYFWTGCTIGCNTHTRWLDDTTLEYGWFNMLGDSIESTLLGTSTVSISE